MPVKTDLKGNSLTGLHQTSARQSVSTETPTMPKAEAANDLYTVRPGDTFAKVCFMETGRSDWANVAKALKIDPNHIKAGQKIDFGKLTCEQKHERPYRQFDNDEIARTALSLYATDNAGKNQCSKGVMNIVEECDIEKPARNHAHQVLKQLQKLATQEGSGWIRIKIDRPEDAPNGSLLGYNHNKTYKESDQGGSKYGHIEIVTHSAKGTLYVSDTARPNNGGTVKHNWDGYAYVYQGKK